MREKSGAIRLKSKFNPIHSPFSRSDMTQADTEVFKTYMCLICGFIYDEAAGIPDEGIKPGTKWEDVPMNWTCPECGARKEDFEMVEF
jgi:rubredoxin